MAGRLRLAAQCMAVLAAMAAWPAAHSVDSDCIGCHRDSTQGKVVHAAVHMGCVACHDETDAATVPHRVKELKRRPAERQCQACHDGQSFGGRFMHSPAVGGDCLACHAPHVSEHPGLLRKAGVTLCLDCHSEVKDSPHVVSGVFQSRHPLGNEARGKPVPDPLRPGKPFYCASCHEPHSSDHAGLTRFDMSSSKTRYCEKCHRL